MPEPTHLLVIDQPWCWAVLAGKLSVANVERIPGAELVGTRIALGAERVDWCGPWLLEGLGVALEGREAWQRLGVQGSAMLEGWVRHEGNGLVSEFYRPGSDIQFRKLRGLSGRLGWVLRKPQRLQADPEQFTRIRARWEETAQAGAELLRYAEQHGTDGLSPDHLRRLDAAEFRKVKAKGKK